MTLIIAAKSLEGMCFAYDTKVELIDDNTGEYKEELHLPKLAPLPRRNDIVLGWTGLIIGGISELYEEMAEAVRDVRSERIEDVKLKIVKYITTRRARKLSNKIGMREGASFLFGIANGINVRSYITHEIDRQQYRKIDFTEAIGLTREGETIRTINSNYQKHKPGVEVLALLNKVMAEELEKNKYLAGKGSGILTPKGYLEIS